MTKIVAVVVCLSFLAGIQTKHIGTRIVGGDNAKPNQFPYQIGLVLKGLDEPSFCGGSLISKQFVLTAAHCLQDVNTATIYIGALFITKSPVKLIVSKTNFIVHPEWDVATGHSDMALIKLPKSVEFTDEIQPINLPSRSHTQNFEGILLTASGWGFTSDDSGDIAKILQYIEMPLLSDEICSQAYPGDIGPKTICMDTSNHKSTCSGDSGGPLIMQESDGSRTLVGVTSFGGEECELGYPTVFNRVSAYLDWISKETGIAVKA